MPELIVHLRALRVELVERMASELAADANWHTWIPVLAEVETALRAVETVMGKDRENEVYRVSTSLS